MNAYNVEVVDTEKSRAALKAFWTNETNWTDERYHWFYKDNGYAFPKTATLVLEEQGDVIGCCSYFARDFSVNGDVVQGGVNCDIFVTPLHRTLGPALMLVRKLTSRYQSDDREMLLGFPNDKSRPVFMRCGYKEIGKAHRWVKILNFEEKIRAKVGNRIVAKVISTLVNLSARWISIEALGRFIPRSQRFTVEDEKCAVIDNFDDDGCIDKEKIYGLRSSKYTAWRYSNYSGSLRYKTALIKKGTTQIGYVVYSLNGGALTVHDISPLNTKYFRMALLAFCRYARSNRHTSISIGFFGGDEYKKILGRLQFLRREGRSVLIYCNDEKRYMELANEQKWYLMDGDLDI